MQAAPQLTIRDQRPAICRVSRLVLMDVWQITGQLVFPICSSAGDLRFVAD
jgi:hypothetical protein